MRNHITAVLALAAAAAALGACNDERRYIGDDGLYQVALTENTAPAFEAEDDALYVVETRVELPVLVPTETSLADLQQAVSGFPDLPFPRMPWVERGDLPIEVDFTLSNLDDDTRQVAVIVNGFNEFDEYEPGVTVIDDEAVVDFSQWERLYELEPLQRLNYTIREEDFDEVAVDLATVVNGAPNSNAIVFFENKSVSDERSQEYIPDVIPGLAGFRIGLRATEAANVLLEATVRVRNAGDRLADEGDLTMEIYPEPFMPVVAEDEE
jgi:hypothetical protein